ncbi:D-lactate dehydrogenase (cytochrome) [Candidatus Protofrankia datiscae]|uniref:D-lactate dehydrogenase (Cytochrome) n=1 Tax=Candidatus Protofrankia datiscae TaxID=2716812 RepID=F8B655_9ACTN|nr:D-lactate dehydrogenase (cytochrome) [Candidatus Protofrankia datiscae]
MARDPVLETLRDAIGDTRVLTDPAIVAGYVGDWTGRFVGRTAAVVRPVSTAGVAAVVEICARYGTPLVPQGGNTGLVGGGVPTRGEIVLSLRGFSDTLSVDAAAAQATVGAGVLVSSLHRAASAAGLAYGVDLASRDSATVGGTVATNAGGLRVLRHGDTRTQLLGVEAVLGDGSVVSHLAGLPRDNTGYHLPSLLAGSEGTLGVVTAVRVRLVPATRARAVGLLGFASVERAVTAASQLRNGLPALAAAELMLSPGLELVIHACHLSRPLRGRHPAYLLVEIADETGVYAGGGVTAGGIPGSTVGDAGVGGAGIGGGSLVGRATVLETLADAVASLPGVQDASLAGDARGCRALWAYRERHTESINTFGTPVKMDVTLPLGVLPSFVETVPASVAGIAPEARTWLFGHVAEGNVHVNVTGTGSGGRSRGRSTGGDAEDRRIEDAVFGLVADNGGSISTEHGIGTAKRRWLPLNRSPSEIAAFRRLKQALDPAGILNPNVLLPAAP